MKLSFDRKNQPNKNMRTLLCHTTRIFFRGGGGLVFTEFRTKRPYSPS